jgi:hypothetical protein
MTRADPLASSLAATARTGAQREEEQRGDEICRKTESERKEVQTIELLRVLLLMASSNADRTRARAAPAAPERALDHSGLRRHHQRCPRLLCSGAEWAHTGQASGRQDAQAA